MKKLQPLVTEAVFWISLWLVYLIAAGSSGIEEIVAGGLVSAGVSLLSRRARSMSEIRLVPRARWLAPFLKVPWTVLQECWLLLVALVQKIFSPRRFRGGTFIEYTLPPAPPDRAKARWSVTTIGVCLTPNDYIIHIDGERNVALIRVLVGRSLSGADRAFLELK